MMKFNASKCYVLRITSKKSLSYIITPDFGKCRPKPMFRISIYKHAQMGYTYQQHIS